MTISAESSLAIAPELKYWSSIACALAARVSKGGEYDKATDDSTTVSCQRTLGSHGDMTIFITRPISGTILAVAVLLILLPVIKLLTNKIKNA